MRPRCSSVGRAKWSFDDIERSLVRIPGTKFLPSTKPTERSAMEGRLIMDFNQGLFARPWYAI